MKLANEKIDELYERLIDKSYTIIDLENKIEMVKDMLLHSTISISECDMIFRILDL